MKLGAVVLSVCLAAGLSGCAAPYSNFETVTVETTANSAPLANAQCTLNNRKGTWVVNTPASVSVHLGSEQLGVTCAKEGYAPVTQMENSTTNVGAILLEGAIMSTVTGAAWNYPQMITVPMQAVAAVPAPVASNAVN